MWVAALVSAGSSYYNSRQQAKNKAKISPAEMQSRERMNRAQGLMSEMFEKRAKDPDAGVMPMAEQEYFNKRRDQVYDEDRQKAQQGLMGAFNRTGTLASGATAFNLRRFGQETLQDKQQFYFQDQQNRINQRESAQKTTFNMGLGVMGTPVQGTAQTDLTNAQTRQRLAYKTQWSNMAGSMANQYMGSQIGGTAAGG